MGLLVSRLLLASAFALAAVAGASAAELCSCQDQSFEWRGCADGASACDAAGWQECTPSPDDAFEIRSGCHVTVGAGDDVLLAQEAGADVRIDPGGRLSLSGPMEWRVGPAGLTAYAGSSVEFGGCYRRFAADAPACDPELEAASLFAIGDVIPCRDGDCNGDAELARISWPTDGSLPDASLERVAAYLGSLDVSRDVLCFWQLSEDEYVGADAGYCYRIRAIGADEDRLFLDFDVRQTWNAQSDQAGYPLARREVQEATLRGAHPAYSRTLAFVDTDTIRTRTDQMGRWIRCAGSQRAYLIASVTDGAAGDAVLLADLFGIAEPLADGTRCHIDWGWSAGDQAFVMAPVHVTSSVNRVGEAFLDLYGSVDWNGVVVDGLGNAGARGGVQLHGGPLLRFTHVWITDPLSDDSQALYFDDLACGASPYHLTITGGPADPEADRNYGLAWAGGASCTYGLAHYYVRHRGDDNFVTNSAGDAPTGTIVFRWIQAGPSAAPGDSGQFLDFGTGNLVDVYGQDGLCTACTSQDGFGSLIIPSGSGSGLLRNLLWVGVFNGGVSADAAEVANPEFRLENVGVIGSAVDPDEPRGTGSLAGLDTDGFYVRDVVDPRPVPMRLCNANPHGNFGRRLSHGVFFGVSLGATPCEVGQDAHLEDVYFIDVARTDAGGPLLEVKDSARDVQLRRLTMAFRSSPVGIASGLRIWPFLAPGGLTLDGPLLTGLRGAGQQAMSIGTPSNAAQITWQHPTCFWDNDVDDLDESLAAYGVPPLRGADPRFVAPSLLRFDLALGSPAQSAGCGAGRAGVAGADWAHRKAKLLPLSIPPGDPSCGLLGAEPGVLLLLLAVPRVRQRLRARRSGGAG